MPRIERIVVESVTRTFGAVAALRAVSITFRSGELVTLEGANGAGKSTLLSLLATAMSPTLGRIVYEPIGEDLEQVRHELGWVAHDSLCYRELTGRENVELAAELYGAERKTAWERTADRVEARAFGDRPFGALSRGQRQRIALARALVHDPSVLLLDEPWTGLDPATTSLLERALLAEKERGTLIILSSHAPEQAERMGARRVQLAGGRIVKS